MPLPSGKEPPRNWRAERAGNSNPADCRLHADQRWRSRGHRHVRQNGPMKTVALSHIKASERPTAQSLKASERKIRTVILHSSQEASASIQLAESLGPITPLA